MTFVYQREHVANSRPGNGGYFHVGREDESLGLVAACNSSILLTEDSKIEASYVRKIMCLRCEARKGQRRD